MKISPAPLLLIHQPLVNYWLKKERKKKKLYQPIVPVQVCWRGQVVWVLRQSQAEQQGSEKDWGLVQVLGSELKYWTQPDNQWASERFILLHTSSEDKSRWTDRPGAGRVLGCGRNRRGEVFLSILRIFFHFLFIGVHLQHTMSQTLGILGHTSVEFWIVIGQWAIQVSYNSSSNVFKNGKWNISDSVPCLCSGLLLHQPCDSPEHSLWMWPCLQAVARPRPLAEEESSKSPGQTWEAGFWPQLVGGVSVKGESKTLNKLYLKKVTEVRM